MSPVLDAVLEELAAVKRSLVPPIDPDAALVADLGLDSLDSLELVARVEQRFRVPVPDDRWKELRTARQIATWVENARG